MNILEVDVVNFESICRFCMNARRELLSIFSTSNDTATDTVTKIKAILNTEVHQDDGMPAKICLKCLVSLNSAWNFKKQCDISEETLRGILNAAKENSNDECKAEEVTAATGAWSTAEGATDFETDGDEDDIPLHMLLETTMQVKRSYVKRNTRKTYKCESCNKTFSKINTFVRHNIKFHKANEEEVNKIYKCQMCDESFEKWSLLIDHEHMKSHYGREKCSYCDRSFSRSYMGEHLRKHTGERPFSRPKCGRTFSCHASYQRHTRHCTNAEKKYQCSYCGQQFFLSYALKEHMRLHTDEKPHICGICKKAFRLRAKLKQHEMIHREERPYLCPTCGRGFKQSQYLKEHMRIHTGVKPYVCDTCDAAFTQGHCLKTHKLKHFNI